MLVIKLTRNEGISVIGKYLDSILIFNGLNLNNGDVMMLQTSGAAKLKNLKPALKYSDEDLEQKIYDLGDNFLVTKKKSGSKYVNLRPGYYLRFMLRGNPEYALEMSGEIFKIEGLNKPNNKHVKLYLSASESVEIKRIDHKFF